MAALLPTPPPGRAYRTTWNRPAHASPCVPLSQVMALVMAPFLLEDPRVYDMFPGDAIARARTYLQHVKGGIGAYSDSKGTPYIRQEVRVGIVRLGFGA